MGQSGPIHKSRRFCSGVSIRTRTPIQSTLAVYRQVKRFKANTYYEPNQRFYV